MNRISFTVAIAALLAGSAAQAAGISSMSGVVSVNQGNGYQTIVAPQPLNAGDMVMVAPGGLVQISYSCGKTDMVLPGAVYTVGDDAKKCAQAAGGARGNGVALALGVGAAVGGGILLFSNGGSSDNNNSGGPGGGVPAPPPGGGAPPASN